MTNWFERHLDTRGFGDRVADAVTGFMGSWAFIIIQTMIMGGWVTYNTVVVAVWITTGAFDPYPFVFLNLFMSAEAAYSSPFILMSQNRQAARDRTQAQHDHESIELLKSELALLKKINDKQADMLLAIQGHLGICHDEGNSNDEVSAEPAVDPGLQQGDRGDGGVAGDVPALDPPA